MTSEKFQQTSSFVPSLIIIKIYQRRKSVQFYEWSVSPYGYCSRRVAIEFTACRRDSSAAVSNVMPHNHFNTVVIYSKVKF